MTTPTPRDTGPALDPRAVEAAAEALRDSWRVASDEPSWFMADVAAKRDAATAVTAAAPFLRAEGAAAAQAEVERLRELLRKTKASKRRLGRGLDAARAEGAAAERQRIAAAIRANHQRAYHLDSTAGPLCICGRLDPCPDTAYAARIAEAEPGTTDGGGRP